MFQTPARSSNLNPIENVFHLINKKLHKDTIDHNKRFQEFSQRAKGFQFDVIDRTLATMNKQINKKNINWWGSYKVLIFIF